MKDYDRLKNYLLAGGVIFTVIGIAFIIAHDMSLEKQLITTRIVILILILLFLIGIKMTYNSSQRNRRRNREQERSLDDMLRLARIKREEAHLAAELRTKFLSNMSHEIRTPINTVLGMNEMIIRETEDAVIRRYARSVAASGSMLLAIINDILDLSKIDSGKMEIIPVQYYIQSTINDLVTMIHTGAKEKGLEIILDISPELPAVLYGDDVRLRQIILNILTNAVKYTPEGSITLSVSGECADNFCVLRVSVKDTGIGIREEDLPKLTSQFVRIDQKKNRNIEGTGLGLSITSQLLELMGSHLEVHSIYGEGSEFWFEVEQKIIDFTPVGEFMLNFDAMNDDAEYSAMFTAPDARLLVVDDNSMNREVFEALLRETEVTIDQADSGKRCLEMIYEKKYDIIFLDYMMPELDGVETLHLLREKNFHYNMDTPVVALTANAVSGAREMYIAEGFVEFLSKPIVPEKLEKTIANLLPKEKLKPAVLKKSQAKNAVDASELPVVEGLDWNLAMLHLPDIELMMESVRNFGRSINTQADLLEGYLAELKSFEKVDYEAQAAAGALDAFRIQVHSMKSSANIIGLFPLAGTAALLEYAARDMRIKQITDMAPHFLAEWRGYRKKLEVCYDAKEKSAEGKVLKPDEYKDALKQLVEAMNCFDVHLSDDIMKWLRSYSLSDEQAVIFEQLEGAVAELDPERCEIITEELIAAITGSE